jgi:hypothetical protein
MAQFGQARLSVSLPEMEEHSQPTYLRLAQVPRRRYSRRWVRQDP